MFSDLTRREFLQKAGILASTLALSGCGVKRSERVVVPFLNAPEEQVAGVFTYYASTCQECPSGCGILVKTMGGRAHKIEGNPRHPVSRGRLCAIGQAGLQGLYNPDRTEGPRSRLGKGGDFESLTWEQGVGQLADAFGKAGPGGVAVLAGDLPDSTYRVADLLLGAIGGYAPPASAGAGRQVSPGAGQGISPTFVTPVPGPSPIIWDAARATEGEVLLLDLMQEVFGQRRYPAFDLGAADLVVSFSANFLENWLSPVSFGRSFQQFRQQGPSGRGFLIQVEPRFSQTAASADRWIAPPPGREAEVALVLGKVLLDENLASPDRVAGVDAVFAGVQPRALATSMGLSFDMLVQVARQLGQAAAPLAVIGGGLGGYENGKEQMGAVMALNLLLGAQNQTLGLAPAFSESAFQPLEQVSSFAQTRALLDAMRGGTVKVLLVLGGDPLHDLPRAMAFEQAAKAVPLVVDFSPFPTDTQTYTADLVLPGPTYLETWGYRVPQVGNPVPVVSAQQPIVRQLYDTRSPVDVLLAVAKRLGGKAAAALPWDTEVDYLKDTVGSLRSRPNGIIATTDPEAFYLKWQQFGGWWTPPGPSAQSGTAGGAAATGATSVKVPAAADPRGKPAVAGGDQARPFILQVYPHPMLGGGQGANKQWLQEVPSTMSSMTWWSWVEVNPMVAERQGLRTGDMVKISSAAGSVVVPVYVYPGVRPDALGMPLGQGHKAYGRYAENRGINPLDLLTLAEVQGTGELAWGATRVSMEKTGETRRMGLLEGSVSRVLPQGL